MDHLTLIFQLCEFNQMHHLTVENLSFSYGKKRALHEVSFQIEQSKFCALLGLNGAGKSTLFSLLTRLITPESGRVSIAGFDLMNFSRKAIASIGVVFQQSSLDLDLTVINNLRYAAALHGLAGRKAKYSIDQVLARMGLEHRINERVRELNGGHRRRTEIARAMIHDPQVLLLDEPTVGLDAETRTSLTDHIHNLCDDNNLTVLWATHLVDEIKQNDQLIIIHQGSILVDGITKEFIGETSLNDYFLNLVSEQS